jgi:prophage maintenance system killer protein
MSQASTQQHEPETLHYLTVQDMLWINLQVTKQVNAFDFAKLEEAVFYQYSYGKSLDVLRQAGQFVSGFAKNKPFTAGSEACAFVGCIIFLNLNGYQVSLTDIEGSAWFEKACSSQVSGTEAVRNTAKRQEVAHHASLEPPVEELVREVIARYPQTVVTLSVRG